MITTATNSQNQTDRRPSRTRNRVRMMPPTSCVPVAADTTGMVSANATNGNHGVMNRWSRRLIAAAVAVVLVIAVALVGSAVHLFPQLRNPFAETTTERSGPVLLTSIQQLSRY